MPLLDTQVYKGPPANIGAHIYLYGADMGMRVRSGSAVVLRRYSVYGFPRFSNGFNYILLPFMDLGRVAELRRGKGSILPAQ